MVADVEHGRETRAHRDAIRVLEELRELERDATAGLARITKQRVEAEANVARAAQLLRSVAGEVA